MEILAALIVAMAPGWRAEAAGHDIGPRPPGQFDYYVLSLSWVPGFCATTRRHAAECGKRLGFALHGLWPQLNGGDYPTECGEMALSPAERRKYQSLYADPSLITHEWPKHGTCSGLPPGGYFALAARNRGRVKIPTTFTPEAFLAKADAYAVKSAFITANPGMAADAIKAVTVGGVLTGIDICMTRSGSFRSC